MPLLQQGRGEGPVDRGIRHPGGLDHRHRDVDHEQRHRDGEDGVAEELQPVAVGAGANELLGAIVGAAHPPRSTERRAPSPR